MLELSKALFPRRIYISILSITYREKVCAAYMQMHQLQFLMTKETSRRETSFIYVTMRTKHTLASKLKSNDRFKSAICSSFDGLNQKIQTNWYGMGFFFGTRQCIERILIIRGNFGNTKLAVRMFSTVNSTLLTYFHSLTSILTNQFDITIIISFS